MYGLQATVHPSLILVEAILSGSRLVQAPLDHTLWLQHRA